jgi:hypothetical protein
MVRANNWKKVLVIVLLVSVVSNLAGAETFRFTASADNRPYDGGNKGRWEWLLDEMDRLFVDDEGVFHIMAGDFDDPQTTDATLKTQFGPETVWYPVVGNHEAETTEDMTWIREAFSSLSYVVNSAPLGCETTTYSFDYGNAHFVAINEYWDGATNDHWFKYGGGDGGYIVDELYNWLVADLENNTKPVVFVIGHEPAYPEYRHVDDSLDADPANRDRFWKLLNDEKVIAYFCGHTHTYYSKTVDDSTALPDYTWTPFTWQVDCGNAGNLGEAVQTFVDVTVTDTDVTFNTWQGTKGNPYTITDSWTVDIPAPLDKAYNPSPSDTDTNVDINADLSWSGPLIADTYDVYFGITSPGTFQGNQGDTTFDPGTMANNTTYYWRVDVVEADSTVHTGDDWSFTTAAAPGQVAGESPVDNAFNVEITTDLNWTAATGADSYDVYFGDSYPPTSIGNQAATTYDPGTLIAGATYYWQIDSVGPGGTTTGAEWSFTTAAAPSQVAGESPVDGASNIDITTDLNWTAATGADTYDVYFGDSYPPAPVGNQAAITYDPGTLDPDTIYYWQIDSVGPGGTTTGAEWSFTTAAAPGQAYDPQPPDGTLAVLLETDLNWSAGSGASVHDVYFGVEPETLVLVSEGQIATTFDPGTLETLDSGTTYYWAIDEVGPGGVTPGQIWTFTTVALPWTDGFESGDLATGGWVTSGLVTITDDAFTGSHAVRTNRPASLEKAISTAGFGSITVSFMVKTFGMDDGEYLYVEWFNGSSWVEVGTVDRVVSDWASQSFNCSGAEDSSSFIIRFRSNADKNREYVFIDDVQISGIPLGPDEAAPTPNPMTWATVPYATGENSIAMTATIASDVSGVEYYFTNVTVTGHNSGWQDSPTYEDMGLDPEMPYTYTVKARDKSENLNETAASAEASATTDAPDTTPPDPDPMTWATVPYATGSTSVSMTATTATDDSGVEYYFDEISNNPGGSDSGWQDSPTYEDTGLTTGTPYTYRVQARDKSPLLNTTGWSPEASATPVDLPPAPPTALAATAGDGQVSLDWDDNTELDISGYNVYRSETPGELYAKVNSTLLATSDYLDLSVVNETTYYYVVTAVDSATPTPNESGDSGEVSATPTAQVSDVVIIVRADYSIRRQVFTVQATSSQGGGVAVLTVVGYSTMTYDAEEDQYQLRLTEVADPPDTVTVESDLGGSDTAPVTHK